MGNTEFTLGRRVAGDGPDTVKIAENDKVTAVRSPTMCELGKRSWWRHLPMERNSWLLRSIGRFLQYPIWWPSDQKRSALLNILMATGPSMCIWLIRSKRGKVSFLFIEDTASYLIQWPAAYFSLHLTPLRPNLFSYILPCIWKWIQLGKLWGGDKK